MKKSIKNLGLCSLLVAGFLISSGSEIKNAESMQVKSKEACVSEYYGGNDFHLLYCATCKPIRAQSFAGRSTCEYTGPIAIQ